MNRAFLPTVLGVAVLSAFGQGRRTGPPPSTATPSQETAITGTAPAADAAANAPPAVEKLSKTQHTIHAGGAELSYTATAGTLVLKREDGKARASIFFVAYTLDSATDKSRRPLTFSFNGGPGSSSVWLHMGALGPKRVSLPADGSAPAPPYKVVDNDQS